ncbi:nickel pincer cofactor biosynthesis protein LarB [Prochlorococcus marinus]|uniref:Circadian phase modifier n=1 Tax=Prochlorococcus marinus str. PAC1 TaxID=59924 RepID=A0A0A2C3B5_PROMR|nr:nickel pincer cofactor biosynthesis protein LarB [Prochlorococcus marinus]KGG20823.1 Circadian phase modifier [Prochlorococcus marinus str. PAC1]
MNESIIDFQRRTRLGVVEAIWGEHKTIEQISEILEKYQRECETALVTRLTKEKGQKLLVEFSSAEFHEISGCLTLGEFKECTSFEEEVIILTGGTSDVGVASEAEIALNLHGIKTKLLIDVGVAGLHRLLDRIEEIKLAKVVIACAGMEGALPTVLAGLIPQPIIGLPVSVGYGMSGGGKTALEGMLASCAPGLTVVNIDNGYGAAMAAIRILST